MGLGLGHGGLHLGQLLDRVVGGTFIGSDDLPATVAGMPPGDTFRDPGRRARHPGDVRPVSSAFDVSEPHTLAVRAILLDTDEDLPVLEGSVTLDSNAEIRGTCDLRIAYDGTRVPVDKDSELAPFGNEIQLFRGIEYPDGEVEMVSLGSI